MLGRSTPDRASGPDSSTMIGEPRFRVAVLGVGLIGGSIALAARERAGAHVTGFDPADGVTGAALARGALDDGAASAADAVRAADAVFVAAPVARLPAAVRDALAAAPATAVVTDVGS